MEKNKYKKIRKTILFVVLFFVFSLNFILAVADFDINSFSCTPSEVVVNDVFSCTAQAKNNGDAAGAVSVATLYPDSSNWLEESSYAQASGTSVDPGQTTEITFTGLRAIKSGNNGFSKIMLDDVTDTYVADNNINVNNINVVVTVNATVSSAVMGDTFDTSAEVTAGGDIDVSLTLTINSGGCSIGSQTNPKSISGMNDGNKQSTSWTITQGTSEDCKYTISAVATGSEGIASKTDSTSKTIDCSDCPSGGSSSSSSGGGGGGSSSGGATTTSKIYTIENLNTPQALEISKNEGGKFEISGTWHTLILTFLGETNATITIESEKQTLMLEVGDIKLIDLTNDDQADISVKLKSINIITNKAMFILNYVSGGIPDKGVTEETVSGDEKQDSSSGKFKKRNIFIWVIVFIGIIVLIVLSLIILKKKKWRKMHGF